MTVSDNTKIQHIARDINLAYSRTMTSQNGTFYDSNQWHATSTTMEKLENLQYNVENNPQLIDIIDEINNDPSYGLTITANDFEFNTVIQDIERYDYLVETILDYQDNESSESLTDQQKNNILSGVTLNADEGIFEYWIHLGKSENEEAIDVAKQLGNNEYIAFAYMKQKAHVENDITLTGAQREDQLEEIVSEIESLGIVDEESVTDDGAGQ